MWFIITTSKSTYNYTAPKTNLLFSFGKSLANACSLSTSALITLVILVILRSSPSFCFTLPTRLMRCSTSRTKKSFWLCGRTAQTKKLSTRQVLAMWLRFLMKMETALFLCANQLDGRNYNDNRRNR